MKKKTISLIFEVIRIIAAAIAGALAGSEPEALSHIANVICNAV